MLNLSIMFAIWAGVHLLTPPTSAGNAVSRASIHVTVDGAPGTLKVTEIAWPNTIHVVTFGISEAFLGTRTKNYSCKPDSKIDSQVFKDPNLAKALGKQIHRLSKFDVSANWREYFDFTAQKLIGGKMDIQSHYTHEKTFSGPSPSDYLADALIARTFGVSSMSPSYSGKSAYQYVLTPIIHFAEYWYSIQDKFGLEHYFRYLWNGEQGNLEERTPSCAQLFLNGADYDPIQ